jgi:hypothetical protein
LLLSFDVFIVSKLFPEVKENNDENQEKYFFTFVEKNS